jgi:hypothetical protein
MSDVTHLSLFYETRSSVFVQNSAPSNSPNTELTESPEAAEIDYQDGPTREIDSAEFEAPEGKGYETAQFIIERAMLDPDAFVRPA